MSASTYLPTQPLGSGQDFPVNTRKKQQDFLRRKKYSLMVMKQSMLRVKTSKHEVYVLSDDTSDGCVGDKLKLNYNTNSDKLISSRPGGEKIQTAPAGRHQPIQETASSECGAIWTFPLYSHHSHYPSISRRVNLDCLWGIISKVRPGHQENSATELLYTMFTLSP